jgi:hypothetical protein
MRVGIGCSAETPFLSAPPLYQVLVQMAEAGEPACKSGGRRGAELAAGIEVAVLEKVGDADYGGTHGAVFVGALCPGKIVVNPEVEAHRHPT